MHALYVREQPPLCILVAGSPGCYVDSWQPIFATAKRSRGAAASRWAARTVACARCSTKRAHPRAARFTTTSIRVRWTRASWSAGASRPAQFDAAIRTNTTDEAILTWLQSRDDAEADRGREPVACQRKSRKPRPAGLRGRRRRDSITYPAHGTKESSSCGPTARRAPGYYAAPEKDAERTGRGHHRRMVGRYAANHGHRRPLRGARLSRADSRSVSRANRRGGRRGQPFGRRPGLSDDAYRKTCAARCNISRRTARRAGVTGYCMGGALALLAAMHLKEPDAAVAFYGLPPTEAGDPGTIEIPLQCHYANSRRVFHTRQGRRV